MTHRSFTRISISWRRVAAATLTVTLFMSAGGVIGYRMGRAGTPSASIPTVIKNATNARAGSTADQVNFGLFWQAWNSVDDSFYGDKNSQKRLDGAIQGMVSSLGDPYTLYFTPEENQRFHQDLQGSFGGIGAELVVKDSLITVDAPLPGSPADKAGIKSGDVITQVDTMKTNGQPLDVVVDHIRGTKGTQVELKLARAGVDHLLDMKVTRDTIVVKSVSSKKVGPDGSISYIKVNEFGDDTTGLLRQELAAAKDSKGIIIDLRNNPGGYLQSAVDALGMLVPEHPTNDKQELKSRVAVRQRDRNGKEQLVSSSEPPLYTSGKVAVLVNGYSASASEILSGALKDYGRATLVGTKTFGKGSVQTLTDLSNGGSMKVTVAKWFTPLGTGIDHQGITPDVVVDLGKNEQMSDSDTQAQRALQLLAP